MKVKIKCFEKGMMPECKRVGDACFDCHARTDEGEVIIPPGSRTLIPLGFALELSEGYEAVVRPRSGLSAAGIDIAIGTIDSNYRGEVKACLINNSGDEFEIKDGDRICQLAVRRTENVEFVSVDELSDTNRGESGFGSSGI